MMLLARAVAIKYGASGVRAHSVHVSPRFTGLRFGAETSLVSFRASWPATGRSRRNSRSARCSAGHSMITAMSTMMRPFGRRWIRVRLRESSLKFSVRSSADCRTCRAAFDKTLSNGSYLVDSQVADDTAMDYAKDPVSTTWTELGRQLLMRRPWRRSCGGGRPIS